MLTKLKFKYNLSDDTYNLSDDAYNLSDGAIDLKSSDTLCKSEIIEQHTWNCMYCNDLMNI